MEDIQGIDTREFTIGDPDEKDRVIRGRVHLPEGTEDTGAELPYVLILHGFKGFMDWGFFPELARRLVMRGIGAVPFNFSGSGIGEDPMEITEDEAFSKNTPSRAVEDVARVRALIDSGAVAGINPPRCGIMGHSFGGGVAYLHAAKRHDYQAIVTWAPVGEFERRIEDVELWRKRGYIEIPNGRTGQKHRLGLGWLDDVVNNKAAVDVVAACARLSSPTLICHGTKDRAVPLDEAEKLRDAYEKKYCRFLCLEGAGHTFGGAHPLTQIDPDLETVLRETVEMFATHLLQ